MPDAAIFALQIVIDAAQGVYNFTLAFAVAITDIFDIQFGLGLAASIASIVLLAAGIVHDVLVYLQQLYNDCANNNLAGEVSWIDGNTAQIYALLASMASGITSLQTTDTTTLTDVQNIQAQLTTFQNQMELTLASDTTTIQNATASDVQGVTSQLQIDQQGLQTDVTTIDSLQTTLSQQVTNQVNNGVSAIQTSLSGDVTLILNEIDNEATGLTTLITAGNQQIMNTLNANFATQQGEYQSNLKVEIETALGTWGSSVPPIQYMLPASQGGFLNSTPVGVQSVVNSDMSAFIALGGKVTTGAKNDLNAANADVAANQYLAAYAEFAQCYEAFA